MWKGRRYVCSSNLVSRPSTVHTGRYGRHGDSPPNPEGVTHAATRTALFFTLPVRSCRGGPGRIGHSLLERQFRNLELTSEHRNLFSQDPNPEPLQELIVFRNPETVERPNTGALQNRPQPCSFVTPLKPQTNSVPAANVHASTQASRRKRRQS